MKKIARKLNQLDVVTCRTIFNWNGRKKLDKTMIWASKFGNGYFYPLIGLVILFFDFAASRFFFMLSFVSFGIEQFAYFLVKNTTRRKRPCHSLPEIRHLINPPDRFSFPSGHSAGAFVMATVLKYMFPQWGIPLYLGASTIGFSRVYNGVHYPSDVLAGSVLGYFSAKLALSFFV